MEKATDKTRSLAIGATCHPASGQQCALCGDVAQAGRVMLVDCDGLMARVDLDGHLVAVALDLLEHVSEGDVVMVHQGFAIAMVSRDE